MSEPGQFSLDLLFLKFPDTPTPLNETANNKDILDWIAWAIVNGTQYTIFYGFFGFWHFMWYAFLLVLTIVLFWALFQIPLSIIELVYNISTNWNEIELFFLGVYMWGATIFCLERAFCMDFFQVEKAEQRVGQLQTEITFTEIFTRTVTETLIQTY